MMIATLLLIAASSPSHAFDRLPAASEALSIVSAARGPQAPLVLAAADKVAGFDVVFAPVGTKGKIAPEAAFRGAKGTYSVLALSADRVTFKVDLNFMGNVIAATLDITRSGEQASIVFSGTALGPGDDQPSPLRHAASGRYAYDPVSRTGSISYVTGGATKTESFSQTADGIKMTLMQVPHVFTRVP